MAKSKKRSNKRLKAAYAQIALNGRKLYWYGEESEVFIAHSEKALHEQFDADMLSADEAAYGETVDCGELARGGIGVLWAYCLSEEKIDGAAKHKSGMYKIPVITFVGKHDDGDPTPQLFSAYS